MLGYLGNRAWTVTAGMHQGGIGGAAGAADQNHHVTTSTGHHIQFNNRMHLQKITGPGFSAPGPLRQEPSDYQRALDHLKSTYRLDNKQAMEVHRRDPRESEQEAVDRVRAGLPSKINDFGGGRRR